MPSQESSPLKLQKFAHRLAGRAEEYKLAAKRTRNWTIELRRLAETVEQWE